MSEIKATENFYDYGRCLARSSTYKQVRAGISAAMI